MRPTESACSSHGTVLREYIELQEAETRRYSDSYSFTERCELSVPWPPQWRIQLENEFTEPVALLSTQPLTFRFRVQPSGGASTYSRSVLGASRNLSNHGDASRQSQHRLPHFAAFSRPRSCFRSATNSVGRAALSSTADEATATHRSPLSRSDPGLRRSDPHTEGSRSSRWFARM